ncbi:hypothetical protein CDAR_37821 [Caerostris darwini]|uniref:Uncharacterized protein n=1 Tax=Caerostris darwini TaxID=1538125 RepID=A0AAV4R9N2_9ARAC|nr:hypothetical protein CDAR_37821 [Caerostris darwini]
MHPWQSSCPSYCSPCFCSISAACSHRTCSADCCKKIACQDEEVAVFESCLNECLHGITWEYLAQHSRDLSREMFCALISSNPRKYTLDKETANVLRRKLFKKHNDPNWSEPCEPIDIFVTWFTVVILTTDEFSFKG